MRCLHVSYMISKTTDKPTAYTGSTTSTLEGVSVTTYSFGLPPYSDASVSTGIIETESLPPPDQGSLSQLSSTIYSYTIPAFSPKTPTYLATSARTVPLTMTVGISRSPSLAATTTRAFLATASVDPKIGGVPAVVGAPIIPVYSPACLGNAYGGGYVITPSVFVLNSNATATGRVPPGYGFSYKPISSQLTGPNAAVFIVGTSSSALAPFNTTTKDAPLASLVPTSASAGHSISASLKYPYTLPALLSTSYSTQKLPLIPESSVVSSATAVLSPTSVSSQGSTLPSSTLPNKDLLGDEPNTIIATKDLPSKDLPRMTTTSAASADHGVATLGKGYQLQQEAVTFPLAVSGSDTPSSSGMPETHRRPLNRSTVSNGTSSSTLIYPGNAIRLTGSILAIVISLAGYGLLELFHAA